MSDDCWLELTFAWRHRLGRSETIAVLYAIDAGYRTAAELRAVLPQLAAHRMETALTDLVAHQLVMLDGSSRELIPNADAMRLDQLTQQTPRLVIPVPMAWQDRDPDREFLCGIYSRIGVIRPALAIDCLWVEPAKIERKGSQ